MQLLEPNCNFKLVFKELLHNSSPMFLMLFKMVLPKLIRIFISIQLFQNNYMGKLSLYQVQDTFCYVPRFGISVKVVNYML